jgi:hypothetical protein
MKFITRIQFTSHPPRPRRRATLIRPTPHTSGTMLQKFHSKIKTVLTLIPFQGISRLTLFPAASIIPCTSPAEGG